MENLGHWKASSEPAAAPQSAAVARNARAGVRAAVSVGAAALAAAAFWMFLIWAIHRESPRTLVSFHGFIHAAIADRFIEPATPAFPPENPFFAGRPVPYYWFFQFVAAQLTRYLGWNIFYSLEAVILAATGLLVFAAVGLGRALFGSTPAGFFMSYLVMAGTNPLGFLFAGWQIVRHGTQVLRDDPNYLWAVVHPLYGLIRYNDIGGLYGPFLNFFLNMTSRPVALAFLLVQIYFLQSALRSKRVLPYLALGSASAITTALSPITGIAAGGTLVLALVVCWLWQRWRSPSESRDDSCQEAARVAAMAIVAGMIVAAPTYYHLVLGPSENQVRFWLFSLPGLQHLMTVALSISPLMVLALIGMRRTPPGHRSFVQVLISAAIVLLGASAAVVLPSWNQSNFFHAAAVMLAVPAAAASFAHRTVAHATKGFRSRRIPSALVVSLFLPTGLLLTAAYLRRPALPASFETVRLSRLPSDSALAHLYQWVQMNTDPASVFVLDPRRRVAMAGNIAEFPAMTGRAIFTETLRHYMVQPYPDARKRFDIAVSLVSAEALSGAEQAYVSNLNRPIYLVRYPARKDQISEKLESMYGRPVFHEQDALVFEWSPQAVADDRRSSGTQPAGKTSQR